MSEFVRELEGERDRYREALEDVVTRAWSTIPSRYVGGSPVDHLIAALNRASQALSGGNYDPNHEADDPVARQASQRERRWTIITCGYGHVTLLQEVAAKCPVCGSRGGMILTNVCLVSELEDEQDDKNRVFAQLVRAERDRYRAALEDAEQWAQLAPDDPTPDFAALGARLSEALTGGNEDG